MDSARFYTYLIEKKYTDITLVLIDRTNRIQLELHKLVLCAGAIYFEKLFENFSESNSKEITLNVPNIYTAYDLIMSFYGQTSNKDNLEDWQWRLEMIKCQNFFGVDQDALLDIDVPNNGFELLLDVIDIIGYDETTINIINRNLPLDFDMNKFPEELRMEMARLSKENHIVFCDRNNNINFYNMTTEEIEPYYVRYGVLCMTQSIDTKILAIVTDDDSIIIYNTFLLIISSFECDTDDIRCICMSSDNTLLYLGCISDIKIYDFDGNFIDAVSLRKYGKSICDIYYSPTKIYFATCNNNNNNAIQFWSTQSNSLIHNMFTNTRLFCFSPDGKSMAMLQPDHDLSIYDPLQGNIIKKIDVLRKRQIRKSQTLGYSNNSKYLVVSVKEIDSNFSKHTAIFVINIAQATIIKSYIDTESTQQAFFTPDDKNVIIVGNYSVGKIWNIANNSIKSFQFMDGIKYAFPINMSVSKYLFRKTEE